VDVTKTKDYHKFFNYYNVIEKIIESLLRSNVYLPFGLCSMNYPIILTDQVPLSAPACTDFKYIYVNPDDPFFKECTANIHYVLTFTLLHEVGHNIFMHKERGEGKDQTLWQYSTDFFLNLLLYNLEKEKFDDQANLVIFQLDKYKDKVLFNESFSNLIEEEIYELLQKNGNFKKEETQKSYRDFLDEVGISNDGVPEDSQIKITKTELQINDQTYKKTFVEFPKQESESQEGESDNKFDSSLAKTMFESRILSRGFENKYFEKFIKRLFTAKVPWDVILRDSILVELQKKGDISYSRPRLIWLAQPSLPYLPNVTEEEVYGTLALLVDESGSMTEEDIAKAVELAQQADSYYKNILVIKHDVTVKWSKLYEEKITSKDIEELCVRRHHGGTSHSDAFQKVLDFEKTHNTFISLVLSLTDMCSNIPEAQKLLPSRIPRIYLKTLDYTVDQVVGKIIQI